MFRRHPALTSVLLLLATVGLYLWSKPAAVASAPVARATPASVVAPAYGACAPSPDGIGKTWMGREISQVMGHPGIGWLERDDREKEEAPSKAIALLELAPDAVLADIGAGSGYYSFRIAPKLPRGKVVAVDIEKITHPAEATASAHQPEPALSRA
jgi:predicted methyltransferase